MLRKPRLVAENLATFHQVRPKRALPGAAPSLAFRDLSFEKEGGGVVVLAGPPGCGSALARIVAGLDRPAEGKVRTTGRAGYVADARIRTLVDLTVRGALVREARLRGLRRKRTLATLPLVVETAGFAGELTQRWSTMLQEVQHRLLLATLICSNTPILVIDGALPDQENELFTRTCVARLAERTEAGLMTVIATGPQGLEVERGTSGSPRLVPLVSERKQRKQIAAPQAFWLDGSPFETIDLTGAEAEPAEESDEDGGPVEDEA